MTTENQQRQAATFPPLQHNIHENPWAATTPGEQTMSAEMLCRLKYDELLERLDGIPQKPLEKLRKAAGAIIEENFERGRGNPKYGNLPRILNKEQLSKFFSKIRNPTIKQAFLIQLFYGLRVSELQTVREERFQDGVVIIGNEQQRTKAGNAAEYLPLIPGTEVLFEGIEYINNLSPGYVSKCFRKIREEAGLDFVYGHAKNTGRPLYLLSSHSLRHTAIDRVRRHSDEYTASVFGRHNLSNRFGVTATYFHKGFDELRSDLNEAFSEWIELLDV